MEFFTQSDLDHFKAWQLKVYNPNNPIHVSAKNDLMATVWDKSIHLGDLILQAIPGFQMEVERKWSKLGSDMANGRPHATQFKHYTWVKIFRKSDVGRQIYFTFGVDAHVNTEAFVYKIDCQKERGSRLNQSQKKLFSNLISGDLAWNEIGFDALLQMNWNSLTDLCVNFINSNLQKYDETVAAIYLGTPISANVFKNKLIKREKPNGIHDTVSEPVRNFAGAKIDWKKKNEDAKELGNTGEELVKQREIEMLIDCRRNDLAVKVEIVDRDGKGYDVLSFFEDGREKQIEVKTTSGNEQTSFYLTDLEFAYLRKKDSGFVIYRVFNYDPINNFAEYFEVNGDIESQLLLRPIQYVVHLKKMD